MKGWCIIAKAVGIQQERHTRISESEMLGKHTNLPNTRIQCLGFDSVAVWWPIWKCSAGRAAAKQVLKRPGQTWAVLSPVQNHTRLFLFNMFGCVMTWTTCRGRSRAAAGHSADYSFTNLTWGLVLICCRLVGRNQGPEHIIEFFFLCSIQWYLSH